MNSQWDIEMLSRSEASSKFSSEEPSDGLMKSLNEDITKVFPFLSPRLLERADKRPL